MFIPSGETIHESLATSYVLVDSLIADLCDGGFSGVVEVVLRETDSFVVIESGNVAAVIEKTGDHSKSSATYAPAAVVDKAGDGAKSTATTYTPTTVAQLAARSRRE